MNSYRERLSEGMKPGKMIAYSDVKLALEDIERLEAELDRLRAEAAKFPVQLSEVVERSTDDMNYWKDRAEKAEAKIKTARADALKEAFALARKIMNEAELKIVDGMDLDEAMGLSEAIEALAQQPIQQPPKRECGTCWHERSSALMVSEPCRSCVDYNNHEPKEGA